MHEGRHPKGGSIPRPAPRCPACRHDHPIETDCSECERCLGDDLSDAEETMYRREAIYRFYLGDELSDVEEWLLREAIYRLYLGDELGDA